MSMVSVEMVVYGQTRRHPRMFPTLRIHFVSTKRNIDPNLIVHAPKNKAIYPKKKKKHLIAVYHEIQKRTKSVARPYYVIMKHRASNMIKHGGGRVAVKMIINLINQAHPRFLPPSRATPETI